MGTWAKLRDGSWGIRTLASYGYQGAKVTVAKKDSSDYTAVLVDRVVWTDGRYCLCKVTVR